jgi:hypothetical protein
MAVTRDPSAEGGIHMKTRPDRWLVAACLVCLVQPTAFPKDFEQQKRAREAHAPVAAAMAKAPMCFEQNVGQSDEQVAFLSRGSGVGIFLTADELVLSLRRPAPAETAERAERRAEPPAPAVLRMRLVGASPSTPVGEQQLETRTNYFIGNDPDRWHTDVANFARVRYADVYPGVDMVYYGRGGQLEYDEVVAAGADPSGIVMEWDGADSIEVDETGALVMKVGDVELRQQAPVLYQETETGKVEVTGRFTPFGGGRVGVTVGSYDPSRALVIDPVLVYSTYLGGTNVDDFLPSEECLDIAVDSSGSAYVAGYTNATDFPAIGHAYDSTLNGWDAFVTKLNPSGTALVYSTFLGGNGGDQGFGIALDSSGNAYVSGYTDSNDYPMLYAYDSTYNGGGDAFVTRLNSIGSALGFSTYLGGTNVDYATGVAVNSAGTVYVAGLTVSADLPTANAYDSTLNGGGDEYGDAFVAKLALRDVLGTYRLGLYYSTYLGGSGEDYADDIAVDSSGNAYVVGGTTSTDFPATAHAVDTSFNGGFDATLSKLSASGSTLVYSTLLGGDDSDRGTGIALDSSGAIYVCGETSSIGFPTAVAYDPTWNGNDDAFVTKLVPSTWPVLYVLGYSTFLGGTDDDAARCIAVDSSGAAYVTGFTKSTDFPKAGAYDPTWNGDYDAFVTKLQPDGRRVLSSTYFGGANADIAFAIAVDASGSAYVAGRTGSADLPTSPGYDSPLAGDSDGFVMKLTPCCPAAQGVNVGPCYRSSGSEGRRSTSR